LAEVFVEFTETVSSEDGKIYTARACGSEMPDGKWQGWIEFVPLDGDEPLRSSRETTQPNRQDTEYWATGLTPVYLEGALHRALTRPVRLLAREIAPPRFAGPADNFIVHDGVATGSVLDPFSVYRKGEALLRNQLSALAGWHLVNIIRRYNLASEGVALNEREPSQLVELIVSAVRNPPQVSS
jgi:hypothetical protein